MAKVLVLYYSAYGHIETMANAIAEGAREAGATVDIKRVPELVPEAVAKASQIAILGTEVMPPGADAVSFIDCKKGDVLVLQELECSRRD